MNQLAGRLARASLLVAGIFLLSGCGLRSGGGGCDGFSQTVRGEGGSRSSVLFGCASKIPRDFPSGVPLPEVGQLRAVVAETHPPNSAFTMTYALGGRNGNEVGSAYQARLQRAGFKIDNFNSVGGTDGDMTQFDAIGKKWDVAVVSGRANPRDRSTLSVQVHTHGQITSGISGIGDTSPTSSSSSTTSTSSP